MKAITIRNVPPAVAEALQREKNRRGVSLNQTVLDLLARQLGIGEGSSSGLAIIAGREGAAEYETFESAARIFAEVNADHCD